MFAVIFLTHVCDPSSLHLSTAVDGIRYSGKLLTVTFFSPCLPSPLSYPLVCSYLSVSPHIRPLFRFPFATPSPFSAPMPPPLFLPSRQLPLTREVPPAARHLPARLQQRRKGKRTGCASPTPTTPNRLLGGCKSWFMCD
jgi:hypothetical protein